MVGLGVACESGEIHRITQRPVCRLPHLAELLVPPLLKQPPKHQADHDKHADQGDVVDHHSSFAAIAASSASILSISAAISAPAFSRSRIRSPAFNHSISNVLPPLPPGEQGVSFALFVRGIVRHVRIHEEAQV